jgi:hemerythrin-like domain-containing protein
MRRLRQDHANLSRLLAALDRQVVVMERGGRPDWDIVQRIVQYCLDFPDLHHHPLEDRVLARLRSKDPAAATPFIGLIKEHLELSAALRRVAAAVEQVLQDATVPRDWFISLVRNFLSTQREHIGREESEFFPAAERLLGAAEWADLDRSATFLPVDPLFETPTDRQYLTLLSDIKAGEAAESRSTGPERSRPKDRP